VIASLTVPTFCAVCRGLFYNLHPIYVFRATSWTKININHSIMYNLSSCIDKPKILNCK